MPMHSTFRASAGGKLILCGEHAVVYGQPAIAVPLGDVCAHATITEGVPGTGIWVETPDLGRSWLLAEQPNDSLSLLVSETLVALGLSNTTAIQLAITSDIPIASGMGSGAAVATAVVRALAAYAGTTPTNAEVAAWVYESERRLHGTPSGIDNTVIAYHQAIWFVRAHGQPTIEPIDIAVPLHVVIADTGVRSPTRLPVGEVRQRWQHDPHRYEALFAEIGECATAARGALTRGDHGLLGALLDQNHTLLQTLGVSSPELDQLVEAARHAGALGAKLTGAGWGGAMFALTTAERETPLCEALERAGAKRVLRTTIKA